MTFNTHDRNDFVPLTLSFDLVIGVGINIEIGLGFVPALIYVVKIGPKMGAIEIVLFWLFLGQWVMGALTGIPATRLILFCLLAYK